MESPKRVEHQLTDKGYVPVYTTSVVEQPWDTYTDTDHQVWAQLFERQKAVLPGRASDEFLSALAAMEPGSLPDLRSLAVAGEACPPALAERWDTSDGGRTWALVLAKDEAQAASVMKLANAIM